MSFPISASLVALVAIAAAVSARPSELPSDEQISAVIPSPNQDLGDQPEESQATGVAAVPIYVSPYVRSERGVRHAVETAAAQPNYSHDEPAAEPAPAPAPVPSYRKPAAAAPAQPEEEDSSVYEPAKPAGRDLKSSASYGHAGHHGAEHHEESHHGHNHGHGWLDMGAWTGGKGSFGWYADYPVGKKHAAGY